MEMGSSSQQKHSKTRDHLSIEIANDDNLLSSIKQKLVYCTPSHSICRVPNHMFKEYEENYYPALVSIGPFHRGRESLKAAECQKWQYFNALLNRELNGEQIVESCIRALREAERKAREFYGEKITISSDEFVEMLLLDCCFIIEIFLEFNMYNLRRRDDPFFSSRDRIQRLRFDLILFENQLPFFVLYKIFQLVPIPKNCHVSLFALASCFFKKLIPGDHAEVDNDAFAPRTHHLLDLIRQYYLPTVPKAKVLCSGGKSNVHQAMQLSAMGIRVERIAISESPANISFSKGKLKIPTFEINVYTEILFRNLAAMEYCDPRCTKHVSSYAFFMKRIIRSKRDLKLLQEKEIVILDGHDEREGKIVQLFERLIIGDVNEEDFYYKGICELMNERQVRQVYYRSHLGVAGLSLGVLFLVVFFVGGLVSAIYFLTHYF